MNRILLCILFAAGTAAVLANIAVGFVTPANIEWDDAPRAELPDKTETDQAKTESGLDAFLQKSSLNIDYVKTEVINPKPDNGNTPIPQPRIDLSIKDRLEIVFFLYDPQDPEKCEATIYEKSGSSGMTSGNSGRSSGVVPGFTQPRFNPGRSSRSTYDLRPTPQNNTTGQQKKYKINAENRMIGTEWRVKEFLPDGLTIEHVNGKASFMLLRVKKVESTGDEGKSNP